MLKNRCLSHQKLAYDPTVGASYGLFSGGGPMLVPGDQRMEEASSLVYTSAALGEPFEILGYPQARLYLEADVEVLSVVVRLCDLAPDGSSALVTKGVLNVTHRESHADPTPIEPGRIYALEIELDATSWQFAPGHRIRLSISHADFPNTWPSPQPATSRVHSGAAHPSHLILPAVGQAAESLIPPVFEPSPHPLDQGAPSDIPPWRVTRDLARGLIAVTMERSSSSRIDQHYAQEIQTEATATVSERDPAVASVKGAQTFRYLWPGQKIEVRTRGHIASDATAFQVTVHAEVTIDDMPHFSRRWVRGYPRRLL